MKCTQPLVALLFLAGCPGTPATDAGVGTLCSRSRGPLTANQAQDARDLVRCPATGRCLEITHTGQCPGECPSPPAGSWTCVVETGERGGAQAQPPQP
jgi:hypothetical protein